MATSQLPMNASAVLVWLAPDETPGQGAFDPETLASTPDSPERWLVLRDALRYARTHPHAGKAPWIKVGERVLGPREIGES